mmetsp:Transcript_24701/g.62078  ORF Transcript_24701/g.62078 Transcript_24701/m.62078 type:complete len:227 (+) Transcript_24701:354-1034(+)
MGTRSRFRCGSTSFRVRSREPSQFRGPRVECRMLVADAPEVECRSLTLFWKRKLARGRRVGQTTSRHDVPLRRRFWICPRRRIHKVLDNSGQVLSCRPHPPDSGRRRSRRFWTGVKVDIVARRCGEPGRRDERGALVRQQARFVTRRPSARTNYTLLPLRADGLGVTNLRRSGASTGTTTIFHSSQQQRTPQTARCHRKHHIPTLAGVSHPPQRRLRPAFDSVRAG